MLNVFESAAPSSSPLAANSAKTNVVEQKSSSEGGDSFGSILNQQQSKRASDADAKQVSSETGTRDTNNTAKEHVPEAVNADKANSDLSQDSEAQKETELPQSPVQAKDDKAENASLETVASSGLDAELEAVDASLLNPSVVSTEVNLDTSRGLDLPLKSQGGNTTPLAATQQALDSTLRGLVQPGSNLGVNTNNPVNGLAPLSAEQLSAMPNGLAGLANKPAGEASLVLSQSRIIPPQNLAPGALAPVISDSHANFDMETLNLSEPKLTQAASVVAATNILAQAKQGAEAKLNVKMQSSTSLGAISGVLSKGAGQPMSLAPNADTSQAALSESLSIADEPTNLLNPAHAEWAKLGTAGGLKTEVSVSFGRAEWNTAVADKVMQMASKNLNFAEIQLDPPELGPLQVRVNMSSEHASVSFTSASAQVREALEQGQQRLKDMFGEEGFDLVDVDVSDQQLEQNDDEAEATAGLASDTVEELDNPEVELSQTLQYGPEGVDAFA